MSLGKSVSIGESLQMSRHTVFVFMEKYENYSFP